MYFLEVSIVRSKPMVIPWLEVCHKHTHTHTCREHDLETVLGRQTSRRKCKGIFHLSPLVSGVNYSKSNRLTFLLPSSSVKETSGFAWFNTTHCLQHRGLMNSRQEVGEESVLICVLNNNGTRRKGFSCLRFFEQLVAGWKIRRTTQNTCLNYRRVWQRYCMWHYHCTVSTS